MCIDLLTKVGEFHLHNKESFPSAQKPNDNCDLQEGREDKPCQLTGNYSDLSTVEGCWTHSILNKRHNVHLEKTWSFLQKSFTSGSSSTDAALILSECIFKAKNMPRPLILATLETKKPLHIVYHCILLRNLFSDEQLMTNGSSWTACPWTWPWLSSEKLICLAPSTFIKVFGREVLSTSHTSGSTIHSCLK